MNPIIKNLVHVIRRFKLAALLNILGLSVAFAAFMVIMIQLNFHFGFDRFHENSDKIFRLEVIWDDDRGTSSSIARPIFEAFVTSSPHIVSGFRHERGSIRMHVAVEYDGERHYFQEHRTRVTPEFIDVFALDFVQGSGDALKTPNHVIIPLSISQRLFGNRSAIGRHIFTDWGYWTVGGVYRDLPRNSIWNNVIFIPLPEHQSIDDWGSWNYQTYIRVNDASNVPLILENFNRIVADGTLAMSDWAAEWIGRDITFRLTALPNVHFVSDVRNDDTPKANLPVLMILFAIGIIILVIAAINFTNFSTALTPMRIRNINTQRVMGAQQRTIRWILVIEAIAFCVASYLVALLLVHLFGDSPLANLISADLSLAANLPVVVGMVLVAIVVGIIAGFYPSRYMTSFAPALALKGNWGLSPKGKRLRNTLIGIQFVASFVLIIGASFMYLQNRFMQHAPLGFDRDGVITVDTRRIQDRDAFENQIRAFAWVEGITYSRELLSSTDEHGINRWGVPYRGEQIFFRVIPAHYAILDVLGISIVEGRGFRQEDEGRGYGAWVFNEMARREFGFEIGSSFDDWTRGEVIGFMPDINYASFRTAVEPMGFVVEGVGNRHRTAYIRVRAGANLREAMAQIRATLAEFDPNYPFQVRFFDEVLQQLYEDEVRLGLLILIFSLIAILISIVGVFGLVVFDSECRRKEIGIRKVMGASTMEVITMFNKSYIKILLICFVIAVPVAWIAVARWLENFAYRTPMYWWVFALAFVAVAAITVLTVTVQNWRVANDDPVKSIKTE